MTTPRTSRPTTVRIFLADGRPDGFRLVEKSNWTGLGLVCARSDYLNARKRVEWNRPGIYFLTGETGETDDREGLYIGEADDLRHRIDDHVRNKEFWTSVIAFTSKDANLNKAHVRYLEARLIDQATKADRVALQNGTAPPLPRLSEADQADMEGYLEEMLLLLPLLGLAAFQSLERQAPVDERLTVTGPDARATGTESSDGFLVFEGSYGRATAVQSISPSTTRMRERLINDGVLVREGERLRFTKPYLFDSPSTAAAVVLGRTANGRIEWKDDAGQTLKARQDAAVDGLPG